MNLESPAVVTNEQVCCQELEKAGARLAQVISNDNFRITPKILNKIDGKNYESGVLQASEVFDILDSSSEKDVFWKALQIIANENGGVLPDNLKEVYVAGLLEKVAKRALKDGDLNESLKKELGLSRDIGIEIESGGNNNLQKEAEERIESMIAKDIVENNKDMGETLRVLGEEKSIWLSADNIEKKVLEFQSAWGLNLAA